MFASRRIIATAATVIVVAAAGISSTGCQGGRVGDCLRTLDNGLNGYKLHHKHCIGSNAPGPAPAPPAPAPAGCPPGSKPDSYQVGSNWNCHVGTTWVFVTSAP